MVTDKTTQLYNQILLGDHQTVEIPNENNDELDTDELITRHYDFRSSSGIETRG